MDKIDRLLEYVRKTNPSMDREKLIEELSKCRYSAVGLVMVRQNSEKSGSPYRS